MVDVKNLKSDKSAFTVRKPKLQLWHIALIGLLIATAMFFSINYGSEFFRNILIIAVTCAVVGLVYMVQNRGFDDKTAAEFQSLVFSGAMRSNNLLTAILYRDGSVFYLDPRYAMNFPKASQNHNLEMLLTTIGVQNDAKIHIYDAITKGEKSEFEYSFKDGRRILQFKLGVYPIQRPEGFITLSLMAK